ncbi:MAG: aminotransferase class III-fold pyridoxal phosphate-dependent enzyme [Candidatus Margulisbacteria bacterium]|nr:aminotransferase class III-fold pyridoxal phosphate-dependent enzyme [Candidatus Margulisiibacteriota bacterium]
MNHEILKKADQYISPVLSHFTRLEVDHAEGLYLYTVDGKKYIDFTSGIGVVNTGHVHPNIYKAICEQTKKLIHIAAGIAYYAPHSNLAEKIVKITGFKEASVFFTQSGSEAIEASLKLARYVSKKKKLLAFSGAFHGRTLGALSITYKEKYKKGYEDWLINSVITANFPYCYRCPYDQTYGKCKFQCITDMKEKIIKNKDDLAAVIIEPVLGEGGYIPAPVEFIQELRYITNEHNIILIFDEIQSGFGRTGEMFAKEHYEVQPDVIALAKAIASGLPLGACVARADLMNQWTTSAHGGTFPGNPVACAASLATIDTIDKEKLLDNAYETGQYMKSLLKDAQKKYQQIGDVRGFGLMIGVEFIKPGTKEPNPEFVKSVRNIALVKGLLLISCGENDQVIRLIPPLIIKKEEIKTAIGIFLDSIREAAGD